MTKLLLFSSCTFCLKTEVYNYSNFSTFKINTMSSSLQSFTYRDTFLMGSQSQRLRSLREQTLFSALVSLCYSKALLGDRRYGIDKFIVNVWHFKVETVFRLSDSFSISVIRFICFHPQYHGDHRACKRYSSYQDDPIATSITTIQHQFSIYDVRTISSDQLDMFFL